MGAQATRSTGARTAEADAAEQASLDVQVTVNGE
jgi:hypothetical protein